MVSKAPVKGTFSVTSSSTEGEIGHAQKSLRDLTPKLQPQILSAKQGTNGFFWGAMPVLWPWIEPTTCQSLVGHSRPLSSFSKVQQKQETHLQKAQKKKQHDVIAAKRKNGKGLLVQVGENPHKSPIKNFGVETPCWRVDRMQGPVFLFHARHENLLLSDHFCLSQNDLSPFFYGGKIIVNHPIC